MQKHAPSDHYCILTEYHETAVPFHSGTQRSPDVARTVTDHGCVHISMCQALCP